MPNLVHGSRLTVDGFVKSVNCEPKTVNRKAKGFSLIELMVVVSLFGIAASLVTASYLNFERNQRVKNAAAALKNDLRLLANKAQTGDKGPGGTVCEANADTLGGWYLRMAKGETAYSFGGVCIDNPALNNWTNEVLFSTRDVRLPIDIKINKISHPISPDVTGAVVVFFRPLVAGVEYFDGSRLLQPVDFFVNATGQPQTYLIPTPTNTMTIELSSLNAARCYLIRIEQTGEVIDEKPAFCS